jgi:two-component system OmpR family sensor kinase
MTFRRKLILLYSALLAVVIVVFGLVVFAVIRKTWVDSVDNTLRETTQQVLNFSSAYPYREFGSPTKIKVDLPPLDIFQSSGVLVEVWMMQPDGTPELVDSSENLGDYTDPLDVSALGAPEQQYTYVRINNIEVRVLTSPIRLLGDQRLLGNVQIAAPLQTINDATNKLALVMIVGGGAAVATSLILGMWLSEQTLKPIEAIIEAAESISTAKDLQKRLPWSGPEDELGRLVSVFNSLMDRIEHLFGVQRRLVADVSHELRTPLTAIRGNLDIIKRYGMDAASLEAIESEAERMSRMVSDLLLLARADYGSMQVELSQIDLDTVLSEVFKEAKVLAKDRDLQIRLAHIEPVRMMGNTDRLKQLLLNLISNAIKFTPDGGDISLDLRQVGELAHLAVHDNGVGIPPEDLERIFDRFYQSDPARSRAHAGDGAGLGLAIAKWIAETHGGTIEAQSSPEAGTTFLVKMRAFQRQPLDDTGDLAVEADESAENGYRALGRLVRRKRPAETTSES